ncbi:DNA methyltransferase [Hoeflea sp.]|uniref:class I SAM-dependent DNA methyltransferase n=1 Tax=Hoeflea sp. TaxID=1940281 RepID=UPI0019AEEDA4|nr:DNA methyltransferase [Hoeflea sp.]MBC7282961.1 class I SAM-dependent DNA methyltransferase [Hoeflea sp.]
MPGKVDEFIERWKPSSGSEMANFQTFANELTDLLEVERPKVSDAEGDYLDYRFERPVTFTHTGRKSRGRIDLYKSGCFVLEAKQGGDKASKDGKDQLALLSEKEAPKVQQGHGARGSAKWDDTMLKARNQADGYARAVSKEDGWPRFLMVVDVGHVIELYADFSRAGQGYTQFPDGNRYRIKLDDLRKEEVRERLRTIWTDPQSLDPSLVAAKVTREIAAHLAELGKSFEGQGHHSEKVANFLMRCLFSMFAEDVELIPKESFTKKLKELRGHPEHAAPTLKALWETMNTGGFSPVLTTDLKRFNGGLFKDAEALPLNGLQLGLLIEAAEAEWKQVEPAIFGTLLERALDKRQRHKLGAHYTPRAYVERLVMPTIIEPLREDWKNVQTAVQRLMADGQEADARREVHAFHRQLCEIRVLDPACGSGNFLYVALEMMKRLEGEVTALLQELGEDQGSLGLSGHTVDPHQFLGIELNPWAAAVAELVLWIGYLQWHFRTHGQASPSEPVLRDFKNIQNRDALLEWSDRTPRLDENGDPVTRWDGITTIRHPVTGEEVPDPAARIQVYDYAKPKPARWPEATFIVGNPPFIGKLRIREDLGDGYVEALRKAYPNVPESADLVMYWWDKAALAARGFDPKTARGTRRFGLITTNSLRQTFNRRVLEPHLNDPKKPLSLLFAVPDHPWVDTLFGAAVRIAMTVGRAGNQNGRLLTVATESREKREADGRQVTFANQVGKIFANLQIGADMQRTIALRANERLVTPGIYPHGEGMVVDANTAARLDPNPKRPNELIRSYCNGRDIIFGQTDRFVIDAFPWTEAELRSNAPKVYQWLFDTVKPHRDAVRDDDLRKNWWLHRRNNLDLRNSQKGIGRQIVTIMTSKHRIFTFLPTTFLPDQTTVVFAIDDAAYLSVLSCRIHVVWSVAAGGHLGVGNDPRYNKSRCFDPFPFPSLTEPQKEMLRALGEELDDHRKRQQAAHPKMTVTQMYNVLEKLKSGETIEGRDKEIYQQGLVGILKDIHDRIDAAVADAYGWSVNLSDAEILFRLVALNKERAAEEAAGHIRWLRPDYQNPEGRQTEAKGKQTELDVGTAAKVDKEPWPKALPEQIAAVREVLQDLGEATPEQIARRFQRARAASVQPLLDSLAALGQAQVIDFGKYTA